MKELRGRNVLITGGALGMGRSLARLMLEEGCRVAVVDIRQADLAGAVDELSRYGEIVPYTCDISDREMVYALADQVKREFGVVDILVNNAGVVKSNSFLEKPDEVIERTIAVNLMAQFWTMKAFLPGMVEKKEGHVVNMASAGGLLGVPYISDYAASKFAVIGLTESLRQEFKLARLRKIRFTYVCPNTVGTGMFAGAKEVKGTKLLATDDVTVKIVEGIKKNRSFIGVPWTVYIVPLTKAITPIPVLDAFNRVMGIATSSKTTTGRRD